MVKQSPFPNLVLRGATPTGPSVSGVRFTFARHELERRVTARASLATIDAKSSNARHTMTNRLRRSHLGVIPYD